MLVLSLWHSQCEHSSVSLDDCWTAPSIWWFVDEIHQFVLLVCLYATSVFSRHSAISIYYSTQPENSHFTVPQRVAGCVDLSIKRLQLQWAYTLQSMGWRPCITDWGVVFLHSAPQVQLIVSVDNGWPRVGRDCQRLETAPSASLHLSFGTVCRHVSPQRKHCQPSRNI